MGLGLFRCYHCGRFLGLEVAIKWIPEQVEVTLRLDPPDFVPIHANKNECGVT